MEHLPWVWDWSSEALAASAAWATFLVAAAAAIFAWWQVGEARKTREDQSQPFVVIDFEPSGAGTIFLDLIIRNTGTTVARNVTFEFDRPLESTMTAENQIGPIAEAAILTRGIPTLPPGREYRILFEQLPDRYASNLPRSYAVKVRFDGPRGRPYTLEYRLDLDIYFGYGTLVLYGEHDAAKALREMNKTFQKITKGPTGLHVWAADLDAYHDRQREELAELRRRERRAAEATEVADDDETPAGE